MFLRPFRARGRVPVFQGINPLSIFHRPFRAKARLPHQPHTCKGVGGEFVTATALNMENPPLPLPGEESGVCAAKNLPFRGRAVKFSFHAPRGMPVPRRSAAWTGRGASESHIPRRAWNEGIWPLHEHRT